MTHRMEFLARSLVGPLPMPGYRRLMEIVHVVYRLRSGFEERTSDDAAIGDVCAFIVS
jgi:hypothetical protein